MLNHAAAVVLAAPIVAWIAQRAPSPSLHMSPSGTVRVDDPLDRGDVDLGIVGAGRVERHPGHAWLRRQIADCVRGLSAKAQEITGDTSRAI